MRAASAVLLPLRPLLGPFSPSPREGTGAAPRHNGMGGKGGNPGGWEAKGVRGPCPTFASLRQPYISPGTRVTAAPPGKRSLRGAGKPALPRPPSGRYRIPGLGSWRARRSASEPQEMFHKPLSPRAGAGVRCERMKPEPPRDAARGRGPVPTLWEARAPAGATAEIVLPAKRDCALANT